MKSNSLKIIQYPIFDLILLQYNIIRSTVQLYGSCIQLSGFD